MYILHFVTFFLVLRINFNEGSAYHRRKSLETVYSGIGKGKNDSWGGRWFPEKLEDNNSKQIYKHRNDMYTVDSKCDDGKTNITLDWNSSPINYTCFDSGNFYNPDVSIPAVIRHEHIPPAYHAYHACMNRTIDYDKVMTTFGTHRPIWARYGEYKFLPRQRWLHNAEHGAVIMLYHPCAHPSLVSTLRSIITSCLYRHIITPYNLLPKERPLALVTWGHYLQMSVVNSALTIQFIKDHALHGPENINKDGLFDYQLETPAKPIVNYDDTSLCPNLSEDGDTDRVRYNLLYR